MKTDVETVRFFRDALPRDVVFDDDASLRAASKDECPEGTAARPVVVLKPFDAATCATAMTICQKHSLPLTPRGAGSGKVGGAVPIEGGVVISLERMTSLVVDADNGVAHVGPGAITADVAQAALDEGYLYPPDPASLAYSTIGGNIATNAGGPRALRYGVTRDHVLGLDVVLPSGEQIRIGRQTTKGVAGFDLVGLLTGSEGTLGVIVGATLKLIPRSRGQAVAMVTFSSTEDAARAVAATLRAGHLPSTIEYLDRRSVDALRAIDVPYTFPLDVAAALLIEIEGDDDAHALDRLSRAADVFAAHHAKEIEVAVDERRRRGLWETRRRLSEATRRITGRKISEDVVVPRARLPELVSAFDQLGQRHGLQTCAFGHAGDGNLHAQVLFDDDSDLPRVNLVIQELFEKTVALGGSISGEHGIGLSKKRYLSLEQSPRVIDLQRAIKRVFDPNGVMNPGKIFPDE